MFRPNVSTNVYVKKAFISFGYGGFNKNRMVFGVTLTDIDLSGTPTCSYTVQNQYLVKHTDVILKGYGYDGIGYIDVTEYVQMAVDDPAWVTRNKAITFLIYQKYPRCTGGDYLYTDNGDSMKLHIHYDDQRARKCSFCWC